MANLKQTTFSMEEVVVLVELVANHVNIDEVSDAMLKSVAFKAKACYLDSIDDEGNYLRIRVVR